MAEQRRGQGPAAGAELPAVAQWRRTLWAMVGIQFVMTGAFSMLSPIMPLYLPLLGVDSASAVALWAGILAGTTSFVAAFASPLWGRLADRRGRKLMLLRSSVAVGVFAALMGAAGNVWQVFACRALMGVFAGFSSTAIALVASQTPENRLGFALGWLSTGQLVGSLVGPLMGGALADATGSYRIPFYCTAATILLTTGFVWFGVEERFVPVAQARGGRALLSSLIALARSPGLLALFFVLLMAQFAVRTVQPVVTLFVKELLGDRPDLATLSGIAFSITGLANVFATPFLGNKSDKIGYRRVLLIALLGASLTTLPQAFAGSYWVFTAQRFALGLFIGGILPAANALVGRLVPREQRGTVYGITASAMFLGNSIGPLSGGAVAAAFGLRWVFLMTAAVLLANLLWVYYRVPEYVDRR